MITGATLFSGGEGVGLGMRAAGIDHRWGIEVDPAIAAVARTNGFETTVADLLVCDPAAFEPVDMLHASPPCPNFSRAKTNGQESEQDRALSAKVLAFIEVLRPAVFTLENVYGYRKSESFQSILRGLLRLGYHYRWWHLNAADYGVPQTRKRLILAAARDFVPQRPPTTHAEGGHVGMFDALPAWVGWHEAIKDLIPGLPDSQFADWQIERLPEELKSVLVSNAQTEWGDGLVPDVAPALSVTEQHNGRLRAFLADGNHRTDAPLTTCDVERPSFTVASSHYRRVGNIPRAFILNTNQNQTPGNGHGIQHGEEDTPAFAVKGSDDGRLRAFVQDGKLGNSSTFMPIRGSDAPFMTVTARHNKGDQRASVGGGRVVQMTPRCLARFQSFPDSYELPDNRALACRIIGNAVPPLLYRRLVEQLLEQM